MAEPIRVIIVGAVGAVALLTIILLAVSLKKLNSDELALKYDTVQKKLNPTPQYEGLHNGPPGFAFIKFPSVFRTLQFERLQCLNKDGVEIFLSIGFQYRTRPNDLENLVRQFNNHDGYKVVLLSCGESAIHDACSKFNTSQFQSDRGAFQEEVRRILTEKFDDVSGDITDLQIKDIERPAEYERAIKDKEVAREEIEVARNERPQKLTEAETKLREAETQAGITMDRALSDARILENSAISRAEGIMNDYTKEAETYKKLISVTGLGLTEEGFLSYMGIRSIENSMNNVFVSVDSPAKTTYP